MHTTVLSALCFQRFKVISITVTPPSDFGMQETSKKLHSKLYALYGTS